MRTRLLWVRSMSDELAKFILCGLDVIGWVPTELDGANCQIRSDSLLDRKTAFDKTDLHTGRVEPIHGHLRRHLPHKPERRGQDLVPPPPDAHRAVTRTNL